MAKPIVVCIPGAFHAPSSWDKVAIPFRQQGYHVLTPPLATCTTTEDAQQILGKTALDDVSLIHEQLLPLLDQGAEALLVSHSYGSVSATLAIQGHTVADRKSRGLNGGIMGLVVIAGYAFSVHGKSIVGDDSGPPVSEYFTVKDGIYHLQETAKTLFYSDMSAAQQDDAWGRLLKAHSRASLCAFPRFIASDVVVPKTYVLCELDMALEPAQQEMFTQIGKFEHVVRIEAGHTPLVSVPERIVDIVVEAAN